MFSAAPRIEKKHVLLSEILAVTSTMRKNSRWAAAAHTLIARDSALAKDLGLRRGSLAQEADLMGGFQELKRAIRDVADVQSLHLPALLGPFLSLIRSPLSTGPITSAALSSVHNFFVCDLISSDSLGLDSALSELSSAVSHCKFEAIVLLKIMTVIHDCICGSSVGPMLGDVEICEMLETVLTTCCQMRLSEILRRSAEATMISIVRTIFCRLYDVDPAAEEAKLRLSEEASHHGDISMTVLADIPDVTLRTIFWITSTSQDEVSSVTIETPATRSAIVTEDTVAIAPKPYGLPALLELFRVLVHILDPNDQIHTDSIRLTALGILNATIETCGTSLIVDHGCKHLFQLARSDNPSMLQAALRTIATLFETMRPLPQTPARIVPNFYHRPSNMAKKIQPGSSRPATPSTPVLAPVNADSDIEKGSLTPPRPLVQPARGETRDLMLETLSQISRHPWFMVDLYTNYDCDINCDNLFERLIDFLTKGVYAMQTSSCLDMLLGFVGDMAARAEGEFVSPEDLMQSKSRKKLVLTGAAKFNSKPKHGIAFLEENGLIELNPSESRTRSLAKFLKSCTRLDKRLLGDYISKPENVDLLKEFIGLFDFKNSEDAVYVLAYSVIMLNTDLHNPQIRKRMTIEDYQRNLRGVNGGENFSPEFLQSIYDSIRKREIIMPEEHTGQLGFEYAWKELLARARQSGSFVMCNTSLFDCDMFKAMWKPVISAIAHAFISFNDEYIIQRAISGFRQCATLAGRFNLPDVFDFIVVALSQATGLLTDNLPAHVPNYPVVDAEGQSITVSSLAVRFGTNFKGQLAAVVLFNIVNGNGNALREGWTQIFEMFQNLFMHSLLPTRMLQMEDFLGGVTMIPLRGSQPSRHAQRNDGGLLSTLSSYLMTPYGSSSENLIPEATDSEVESTLCTIDCIKSCRLDELYGQIMQLDAEALVAAVKALEALAHERTVTKLKEETDDVSSPYNPSPTNEGPYVLTYDPAAVFLLETMVSIACQTPQHLEDLWPIIFEHLSALLSTAVHYSVLLIERAVVALLRLCVILVQKGALRDQVYLSLDIIANLPPSVANSVAEHVTAGVSLILQREGIVSTQTEWNVIGAALRTTISHSEAARYTFSLVASITSEARGQKVTQNNFPCLVAILDDFATAAGASIRTQPQRSRRALHQPATESPVVERGRKAVDLLSDLKRFIAPLSAASNLPPADAWRQYCLPLLSSLGRQSTNPSRLVRNIAIVQLQRLLLGSQLVYDETDHGYVEEIFDSVIFPLIDDLLKPQVYHLDPSGISETRLRASTLLCKAFMHFEVRDGRGKADVRAIWIEILDLLDRLVGVEQSEQLYEAVSESLKNAVLVMNAADILVPPSERCNEQQRTFWSATHARLERFLPGLLAEVIPPPETAEPAVTTATTTKT
ncbi:hypothetical protein EDD16DRAFT_1693169 [Pisolithus croceorrhizus]|nr:hypothetical protein EDD16DRAFT_1693169 [Pisolithus croceorrhizus]